MCVFILCYTYNDNAPCLFPRWQLCPRVQRDANCLPHSRSQTLLCFCVEQGRVWERDQLLSQVFWGGVWLVGLGHLGSMHSLTDSPTPSLIHSLAHTHPLTHSPTHSFTHSLTHSLTHYSLNEKHLHTYPHTLTHTQLTHPHSPTLTHPHSPTPTLTHSLKEGRLERNLMNMLLSCTLTSTEVSPIWHGFSLDGFLYLPLGILIYIYSLLIYKSTKDSKLSAHVWLGK